MSKYILVESASGEINHSVYDNLEAATADLIGFCDSVCNLYNLDEKNLFNCIIGEDKMEAFASVDVRDYEHGCIEHCTWGWKIIEV